jgi:hypothetical protein
MRHGVHTKLVWFHDELKSPLWDDHIITCYGQEMVDGELLPFNRGGGFLCAL